MAYDKQKTDVNKRHPTTVTEKYGLWWDLSLSNNKRNEMQLTFFQVFFIRLPIILSGWNKSLSLQKHNFVTMYSSIIKINQYVRLRCYM